MQMLCIFIWVSGQGQKNLRGHSSDIRTHSAQRAPLRNVRSIHAWGIISLFIWTVRTVLLAVNLGLDSPLTPARVPIEE